jgi:AAA family ATP:ADP antiporter
VKPRSRLDRLLGLFAEVRAGEGATVAPLAANLCLLLFAYYLLKTIREPLILGTRGGGAEIKSYAAACQGLILVAVSLGFGALTARFHRMKVIALVTLFFVSHLIGFYLFHLFLPRYGLALGVAFFIWVGCFNVMIVAQFWAFANDLYRRESGERLFAIVGGGSALGALAGARFAKPLLLHFGPHVIMLIAAGLLCVSILVTRAVHRRELAGGPVRRRIGQWPVGNNGSFALLLRDRYLLLVGALSLLKNWVNTTGEYILDRQLLETAHQRVGTSTVAVERFIGAFKSDYFTYVNALVLVLQFLAVSRIIRILGVRRALFVLPALALVGYGAMAALPLLGVIFVGKIGENSVDYSLQKTVEQTLFLVTSREAKYKVKAIVDTFLVRAGDLLTAILVWTGVRFGLGTVGFIVANLLLLGALLVVVALLGRAHGLRSGEPARAPSPAAEPLPELVPDG